MQQRVKKFAIGLIAFFAAAAIIAAVIVFTMNRSSALSLDTGVDSVAPEITVDLGDYHSYDLPTGIVGMKYSIFTATAFDAVDGECDVVTRVYSKGTNRNLYDEGTHSFTPAATGLYVLEYSSEDRAGNESVRKMGITVEESVEAPSLNTTLEDTEHTTGTTFKLPYVEASGGSGILDCSITVKLEDEVIFSADDFGRDYAFTPTRSGAYVIEYRASDFFGRECVETFTVTANASTKPVLSEIHMPDAVLSGSAVRIPSFEALDYAGDGLPKEVTKSVEVEFAGKKQTVEEGSTFTPVVEGALGTTDTMKVTFLAEGSLGTETVVFDITVVNVKDAEDTYFLPAYMQPYEAGSISAVDDGAMKYQSTQDGASMRYIKDSIAEGFSLRFVPYNANSFTVRVFDSQNEKIAIDVTFIKNTSATDLKINGQKWGSVSALFETTFTLSYSQASNRFTINQQSIGMPERTVFGEVFGGFPSGKVRFSVTFDSMPSGQTGIFNITGIGNQLLSASQTLKDTAGPEIHVEDPAVMPRINLGDSFVLPKGYAVDFLSDNIKFTVSVTVNGATVLEPTDPSQEIVVKADKYGYYRITYTATDDANKSNMYSCSVYVVDDVAPELTVEGNVPSSAKVGSTVELPSFTAEDNMSYGSSLITRIFVLNPSYHLRVVQEDDDGKLTFIADRAGKYTIRYYAEDEDGNYTYKDFIMYVI